jgi:hypothetical protein
MTVEIITQKGCEMAIEEIARWLLAQNIPLDVRDKIARGLAGDLLEKARVDGHGGCPLCRS